MNKRAVTISGLLVTVAVGAFVVGSPTCQRYGRPFRGQHIRRSGRGHLSVLRTTPAADPRMKMS